MIAGFRGRMTHHLNAPPEAGIAPPSRGAMIRASFLRPEFLVLANLVLLLVLPFRLAPYLDEDTGRILDIARDPVTQNARITRIQRAQYHHPYGIRYEFVAPDGRLLMGTDARFLELDDLRLLPPTIPVIYPKGHPELSMPVERYESRSLEIWESMARGAALLLFLMIVLRWASVRYMLSRGRRSKAVVEKVVSFPPGPPLGVMRVTYRLSGLAHAPLRTEILAPIGHLARLRAGQVVDVMLHGDDLDARALLIV